MDTTIISNINNVKHKARVSNLNNMTIKQHYHAQGVYIIEQKEFTQHAFNRRIDIINMDGVKQQFINESGFKNIPPLLM